MLLGFAAAAGDTQAAQAGVEPSSASPTLDPDYASGWANLAALYEELGDDRAAVDAMRQAADLAPESWSLVYRYGIYAEAAGDDAGARKHTKQADSADRDIVLIPDWDHSPLRRALTG